MKKQDQILSRNFYSKNTLQVAKSLLGSVLVCKINQKEIRGIITETEAYMGEDDLASHASKGRTPRTQLMFGEAGHAYIYLVYGMYHCLNVVTGKKDYPAAVLIRAVKIDGLEYKKTNGPGKLCKAMGIDKSLNGIDVTTGKRLWLEKGKEISKDKIKTSARIGVAYAKHSALNPWRFYIDQE